MTQKYLKYDEISGQITDANASLVYTLSGFIGIEIDAESISSVDEMIKLKNAGFTAQDIIEIKKAGL